MDLEVEILAGSVWELRDGRVARIQFFDDRAEAFAAAESQSRLQELQRDHGDEVTLICSYDARMLEEAQVAMSPAPAAGLN